MWTAADPHPAGASISWWLGEGSNVGRKRIEDGKASLIEEATHPVLGAPSR
jgi:hypothetical protein